MLILEGGANVMARNNDSDFIYVNLLRGFITEFSFSGFLILIKKVREEVKLQKLEENPENLFKIMTEISHDLGLESYTVDLNTLETLYNMFEEQGEYSWEDIVTFYNDSIESEIKVPNAIVDEMVKKTFSSGNNVLIAEAEKFSSSLVKLINSNTHLNFTLVTEDQIFFKLLKIVFNRFSNVKIFFNNIYDYDFIQGQFDIILAIPDFQTSKKVKDNSRYFSTEFAAVALENLLLRLTESGRLSIVLPRRISVGTTKTSKLREYVQSNFGLVEIVDLPSGTFKNSSVMTCLLTISSEQTQEISIKKVQLVEESGKSFLKEKQSMVIEINELIEQGNWTLDRIFHSKNTEWIKFIESEVKKEELGNVTTIFRGKSIVKKGDNGNIGVINISDIGNYEVNYSKLKYIEGEERKVASYLLKNDDLLVTARGTEYRTALFEEQPFPIIASSNIIVIRANDERLSTTFLKIFLDSSVGRNVILSTQQGGNLLNINYKELAKILIPLPTIEDQMKITKKYRREYDLYKSTILAAEKRWDKTIEKLRDVFIGE